MGDKTLINNDDLVYFSVLLFVFALTYNHLFPICNEFMMKFGFYNAFWSFCCLYTKLLRYPAWTLLRIIATEISEWSKSNSEGYKSFPQREILLFCFGSLSCCVTQVHLSLRSQTDILLQEQNQPIMLSTPCLTVRGVLNVM